MIYDYDHEQSFVKQTSASNIPPNTRKVEGNGHL